MDRIPDDIRVHVVIIMDEKVSHGYHVRPWDIRMPGPCRIRYPPGSFADDFDATDDRVLAKCVEPKGFEGMIANIGQGEAGRIEDILHIGASRSMNDLGAVQNGASANGVATPFDSPAAGQIDLAAENIRELLLHPHHVE